MLMAWGDWDGLALAMLASYVVVLVISISVRRPSLDRLCRHVRTLLRPAGWRRALARTALLLSLVVALFSVAWPMEPGDDNTGLSTAYAQAGCNPRPPVRQQVSVTSDSRLRVVVTAGFGTLQELRFLTPLNGLIDIGAQTAVPGDFTYTVPPGLSQVAFVVRRSTPNQPTTVKFIAHDGCGDWTTFSGAGTAIVIVTAMPGSAVTLTPTPTNTPTSTPSPTATIGLI